MSTAEPDDARPAQNLQDPAYIRLQVELVLEVSDPSALGQAALQRIAEDDLMPDTERGPATEAASAEPAEALAYLVDPIDLVSGLPGVELTQASWSSEAADGTLQDPDAGWFTEEHEDGEADADGDGAAPR